MTRSLVAIARVAHHGVEVDDGVERTALTNPRVDRRARGLVVGAAVLRAAERQDRRAVHAHAARVRRDR